MLNIVDVYHWDEHRKVLTPQQTGIPALRMFGISSSNRAVQPLQTHIHAGCMEIVFLLKGFQIYEAAGTHFNLSGSDLFVAYPDEPHSSGDFPESVSDLIWMQIDLSESLPFFGLDETSALQLKQALLSLPRLFGGDASLRSLLQSAFSSLSSDDPLLHLLGQQQMVCAFLQMKRLSQKVSPHRIDSIGHAITYIHDNLNGPISLEDVAAHCGLSLSRFKVKFRESIGTTPRDYINRVRIEQAKRMLRSGETVTHTAMSLGFSTSNYFAVQFKKYTGLTPSQFRTQSPC